MAIVRDQRDPIERPDPRPCLSRHGAPACISGVRCSSCAYVAAESMPRCPVCQREVQATEFLGVGVVWSSTVIRVPVPGRTPPFGLAYIDLDSGPRVLAHLRASDAAVPVGRRVRIDGLTETGEILAMETT